MYNLNEDIKIHVASSIAINATPEEVWKVLSDLENWKNWTRFVVSFEGDFNKDGNVKVVFNTPQGEVPFDRRLVIFEENKVFCWEGEAMWPDTVDHHVFHLEATKDGKTILTQADGFQGIERTEEVIAVEEQMKGLYALMNQELKQFVEK